LNTGNNILNGDKNYKCLIHLDRLQITFRHLSGSTFRDIRNPDSIPMDQVYNNINLIHDTSPGTGAYYHSFKVYYKGYLVGRLFTATKLKKHELQFDFEKSVFYSFYPGYWYEIYVALKSDLGIIYNNIKYVEISVDTNKNILGHFSYLFINSVNYLLGTGNRYKLKNKTMVHILNNGHSFVIKGSKNEISIYDKAKFSEKFILDYFSNNGFLEKAVYRIESKLNWDYIRYLRSMKLLDINVETLIDPKYLATIFRISTMNKITFMDLFTKEYDGNRNPHYQKVSVTDDLPLESAEIGKLNDSMQVNHYKTGLVDENILRQNYFRYLETGCRKYLMNFKASGKVAGYNRNQLIGFISKFNSKYRGNRTNEITERMEYAVKYLNHLPQFKLSEVFYGMGLKLRWQLMGLF
jgi:hypothetical protein